MPRTLTATLLALSTAIAVQTQGLDVKTHTLKPTVIQTITMQHGKDTVLQFPSDMALAEWAVGDSAAFSVGERANILTVTALKPGGDSTLNVITADADVFTWLLKEGVPKGGKPDLRIMAVRPGGTGADAGKRSFISLAAHEAEMQALRDEHASMKAAVVEAGTQADARVEHERVRAAEKLAAYPLTLRRYHSQPLNAAPFFVKDVFADDEFTWVQITMGSHGAADLPAIYETLDGKPALLSPIMLPGRITTFKIPKVVREGYLVAGKDKWRFALK